ncbi:hypothetical protein ISS42_01850 [Candidatus Shapirobacteria bacterium]|nr:hypothetical protein [Candidatus Shapirobacteria bacterium]
MKQKGQFNQLVWDYNLSPKEFKQILEGKKQKGWFTREWATARALENLNYYQALDIIDLNFAKKNWAKIKPKIFNKAIIGGYEYLLQK